MRLGAEGDGFDRRVSAGLGRRGTNLLHDASLALGECDVATRLVTDELDLNLATLAIALLVIIIIVVGCRASALNAATLTSNWVAIADVRVIKFGGRRLVVGIGDVGHFRRFGSKWSKVSREIPKRQNGGDAVLSVVPMA